ncbi:hypothetical protein BKA70DRAFT_1255880 [Coprinopsis sp. MPI-PUGE-AT-0042]|nr:hypothetical protein BKA70DRAFT_1255880 [Coprinopsis sp. MPI-PUGE-AT-0042]
MDHRLLVQYGRYQASFSGRSEVEDHQPNESLRGRSNGPPALRTAVVSLGQAYPGRREFGASGRGRGGHHAHNPRPSASNQVAFPQQAWRGKRQNEGGNGLHPTKKHKSQHVNHPLRPSLPQRPASSTGAHSGQHSFVTPPPPDINRQEDPVASSSAQSSTFLLPPRPQRFYPTPSPSSVSDASPHPPSSHEYPVSISGIASLSRHWLTGSEAPRLHAQGFSAPLYQPDPLPEKPSLIASGATSSQTSSTLTMEPLLPLPIRGQRLVHPHVPPVTPATTKKQIHSVVVTVKKEVDEPMPMLEASPPPEAQPTIPLNRPRTNATVSPISSAIERITAPPHTPVKQEPEAIDIDTVPEQAEHRLITSRCEHYEWPDNCRKSNLDVQKNRKTFMRAEVKLLEGKRLTVTKRLFREDGMVLEWISPIAVWNDTLLPEEKHESIAGSINSSATPEQRRLVEAVRKGTPPRTSNSPSRKHVKLQPGTTGSSSMVIDSLPQGSASSTSQEAPEPPLPAPRVVRPSQRDRPTPKSPKRKFRPVQRSKLRDVQGPSDPRVSDSSTSPPSPRDRPAEVQTSQATRGRGSMSAIDLVDNTMVGVVEMQESLPPLPKRRPRRSLANASDTSTPRNGEATSQGLWHGNTSDVLLDHPVERCAHSDYGASSEEREIGVSLAEAFIMKYMGHFDEDRPLLEMAYTTNATFSCSIHETSSEGGSTGMAELFACQPFTGQGHTSRPQAVLVQGRTKVVDSLQCLGPYLLSYDDSRRPFYDVAVLTMVANRTGTMRDLVLLTVHGDAVHANVETGKDHVLSVDQTFLLCRPEDLEDWEKEEESGGSVWGSPSLRRAEGTGDDEEDWPLLALSHQMVVRDKSTVFPGQLVEEEPWIAKIMSLQM